MKLKYLDIAVIILVLFVGIFQLVISRTLGVPPIFNNFTLVVLFICGLYFLIRIISRPEQINSLPLGTESIGEEKLDDTVFDYLTKRYGFGYLSMENECVISEDGSAIFTRRIELITESDINYLETSLTIPTEKDGEWDIKSLRLYSTTANRQVTVDAEKLDKNMQSVQIVFSPPLRPGDKAGYVLVEELPKGFYSFSQSLEELKAKRKPDDFTGLFDYFGWHINRPTMSLKLKVQFPEKWKPRLIESKVLLAKASGFPSANEQRDENRLLKFNLLGPEVGKYRLELDINYPMIGLIYIASWQPIFLNE